MFDHLLGHSWLYSLANYFARKFSWLLRISLASGLADIVDAHEQVPGPGASEFNQGCHQSSPADLMAYASGTLVAEMEILL